MFDWKKGMLAGMVACSMVACGDSNDDAPDTTPDGQIKLIDGKADAWNYRNDVRHLRLDFEYELDKLPSEGYANKVAWAGSYWPYYQDGINYRWQGKSTLSPAEKYDKAFNDWAPADDFMDLNPVNLNNCEFDQEYYDGLGPAALHTTKTYGNYRLIDGIDGDNDGTPDEEECSTHDGVTDYDGIETWFGICHAWAPAALLEDEPVKAIERNGMRFEVSDMKALLMQQYDRASAYSVGGRCYDEELEFDETGRVKNEECRDLNAGSWHLAITNMMGENSVPLVIERTTDYEIWNQPMLGYEVTEQREITLEEALELLNLPTTVEEGEEPEGTGEFVHNVEEGTALAAAILNFANTATFTELDDDARLYRTAASYITYYRPFSTLKELDDAPYVGPTAFRSLTNYVETNDLVNNDDLIYKYNPAAAKFVEIRMTTDWVTESHALTTPTTDVIERYTRHDYYHYILELDADGKIIGGEWVGSSNSNHPDFVWRPLRPISGNPHIDIDEVRDMIRESREDLVDPGNEGLSFTSNDVVSIPDNDPTGATSTLEVAETGVVKTLSVDLKINHTYRGDLIVELRKGPQVALVYDGRDAETPWADDVNLEGKAVAGFENTSLEGTWELFVTDNAGYDVGEIVEWTLNAEIE